MKNIVIFFLFSTQHILCQTMEISGVVKDKTGPLLGVNINAKGTEISTFTDINGYFKFQVPDSTTTLIISYLGYETKELKIDNKKKTKEYILNEEIIIEEEVISCYFYPRFISANYFGGLNHSKSGLFIDYFDPYLLSLPFTPNLKLGFQKSKNNEQVIAELELRYLIYIPHVSLTPRIEFSKIKINNLIEFESLKIEADISKSILFERYTSLIVGFGKADISNKDISKSDFGCTLGIGQNLPLNINLNFKTTYWISYWQFETEFDYSYKNLNLFYRFNSIESYMEHNIGLGYRFYF